MADDDRTSIALDVEAKEKLRKMGEMGESYQDVILRLIEFYLKNKKSGKV